MWVENIELWGVMGKWKLPGWNSALRLEKIDWLISICYYIPSYSGPLFSRIRTEYGEILNEGTSCQMKLNTGQNNSKYGHFLRNIEIQE